MDRAGTGFLKFATVPTHVVVAATAWGSRVIAAAAQLLVLRILLPFLGPADYALFTVVTSLATWFALVDAGVGNSVQNRISQARSAGRERATIVRSVLPLLAALLGISAVVLFAAGPPLQALLFRRLEADPTSASDAGRYLVAAVGLIYVIANLANVSFKVFYGEMRGYVSNAYVAVANLGGLAAVIAVRSLVDGERLTWALLAWTVPPAIVGIVAAIHMLRMHADSAAASDPTITKQLWSRAWKFGGFAAMSAAVLGIDYVVMSQSLRPEQIVQYNATAKVYGFIFFLYSSLLQATWPVSAEAFARRDFVAVRQLTRNSLVAGTVIVAAGTLAFVGGRGLVSSALLGSRDIMIPASMIVFFGGYFLLRVWSDTFAMILMSRDRLRVFWLYVPFQAIVSAGGQILLAPRFGVYGVLAGLALSFLVTAAWILPADYLRATRPTGAAA